MLLQTVLIVSQDGADSEVSKLIDSIDFMHVIHLRHSPPYPLIPRILLPSDTATAGNVWFLLRLAFEHLQVRAAVVLEADVTLSPDGLDYFRWAYEKTATNSRLREKVFSINGYVPA